MRQTIIDYEMRARFLRSQLQQLHRLSDITATGATIHRLHNSVAAAVSALQMFEAQLQNGDPATLDLLLSLAQEALEDIRAIITRTRLGV